MAVLLGMMMAWERIIHVIFVGVRFLISAIAPTISVTMIHQIVSEGLPACLGIYTNYGKYATTE